MFRGIFSIRMFRQIDISPVNLINLKGVTAVPPIQLLGIGG